MLRRVILLSKNVNDFLLLNFEISEFAKMRFHCPNGQMVLRSCAP